MQAPGLRARPQGLSSPAGAVAGAVGAAGAAIAGAAAHAAARTEDAGSNRNIGPLLPPAALTLSREPTVTPFVAVACGEPRRVSRRRAEGRMRRGPARSSPRS